MEGRRERQLTQSNPSSPYTYFFLHSTSSSSVRQQQCEEKLAGIVPTNLVRVPKLNLSLSPSITFLCRCRDDLLPRLNLFHLVHVLFIAKRKRGDEGWTRRHSSTTADGPLCGAA